MHNFNLQEKTTQGSVIEVVDTLNPDYGVNHRLSQFIPRSTISHDILEQGTNRSNKTVLAKKRVALKQQPRANTSLK